MARIPGKGTVPELVVRKAAHSMGLRFRLHQAALPGKPDLVFPRRKFVLFVHGCFWHQHHGCRRASLPKSRLEYWHPKLQRNVDRDRTNHEKLKQLGWKVGVLWECQVRSIDEAREGISNLFSNLGMDLPHSSSTLP